MSISDDQIVYCNNLAIQRLSREAASKSWELGKKIGVTFIGDENEIIDKIVEMENRDREVISLKGVKQGLL